MPFALVCHVFSAYRCEIVRRYCSALSFRVLMAISSHMNEIIPLSALIRRKNLQSLDVLWVSIEVRLKAYHCMTIRENWWQWKAKPDTINFLSFLLWDYKKAARRSRRRKMTFEKKSVNRQHSSSQQSSAEVFLLASAFCQSVFQVSFRTTSLRSFPSNIYFILSKLLQRTSKLISFVRSNLQNWKSFRKAIF